MGKSLSVLKRRLETLTETLRGNGQCPSSRFRTTLLTSLILASVLLPTLGAQTAPPRTPPKSVDDIKVDSWNSLPLHGSDYRGVKSAPAPKRDLSGIWDATGDRVSGAPAGIQINGVNEHRSVLPGNSAPTRWPTRREKYPESLAIYTPRRSDAREPQADRTGSPSGSLRAGERSRQYLRPAGISAYGVF